MKKMVLMLVTGMGLTLAVSAQPGGFQHRTVEERVKIAHEKLDSAFKLDPAKLSESDSVFANYYRSSDKLRQEFMGTGQRPDFSVMREKMQPLMETRDKELQAVLNSDQFKIWKDQIEPSMRPRRPGGGR